MSAKLTIVYWRDIPAQVIAQRGRERKAIQLSQRFQEAIDSAAMVAGATDASAYMEDWRKDSVDCSDDLETEAQTAANRLEAAYSKEDLKQLIRSKGYTRPKDLA
jgi:hypothetical protein